jgi:hypothetical protein
MVESLWAILYGSDSRIAATGLGIVLVLLFTGSVILLVRGVRDLIRDLLRAS